MSNFSRQQYTDSPVEEIRDNHVWKTIFWPLDAPKPHILPLQSKKRISFMLHVAPGWSGCRWNLLVCTRWHYCCMQPHTHLYTLTHEQAQISKHNAALSSRHRDAFSPSFPSSSLLAPAWARCLRTDALVHTFVHAHNITGCFLSTVLIPEKRERKKCGLVKACNCSKPAMLKPIDFNHAEKSWFRRLFLLASQAQSAAAKAVPC